MASSLPCPKCQATRIKHLGRKYEVYPLGCLYLLGFPLAYLHQGQQPQRFCCATCGAQFKRRSAIAWINFVIILVIALILAANLVVFGMWVLRSN